MYTARDDGTVVRDDGAIIPPDTANRDYQAYLEWVADGGVPDTVAPPVTLDPIDNTFGDDTWQF